MLLFIVIRSSPFVIQTTVHFVIQNGTKCSEESR